MVETVVYSNTHVRRSCPYFIREFFHIEPWRGQQTGPSHMWNSRSELQSPSFVTRYFCFSFLIWMRPLGLQWYPVALSQWQYANALTHVPIFSLDKENAACLQMEGRPWDNRGESWWDVYSHGFRSGVIKMASNLRLFWRRESTLS